MYMCTGIVSQEEFFKILRDSTCTFRYEDIHAHVLLYSWLLKVGVLCVYVCKWSHIVIGVEHTSDIFGKVTVKNSLDVVTMVN